MTRYYIVSEKGSVQYIKLESELSFSVAEGIEMIKENRPNATIESIAKSKAEKMPQWTPENMDIYYKAARRFSYNDVIKFAHDYHENELSKLRQGAICSNCKSKNVAREDVFRCKDCNCFHDENGVQL